MAAKWKKVDSALAVLIQKLRLDSLLYETVCNPRDQKEAKTGQWINSVEEGQSTFRKRCLRQGHSTMQMQQCHSCWRQNSTSFWEIWEPFSRRNWRSWTISWKVTITATYLLRLVKSQKRKTKMQIMTRKAPLTHLQMPLKLRVRWSVFSSCLWKS